MTRCHFADSKATYYLVGSPKSGNDLPSLHAAPARGGRTRDPGFLKQSLSDAVTRWTPLGTGRPPPVAAGKRYDVLVVDLGLPDQDGIDLILSARDLVSAAPS